MGQFWAIANNRNLFDRLDLGSRIQNHHVRCEESKSRGLPSVKSMENWEQTEVCSVRPRFALTDFCESRK